MKSTDTISVLVCVHSKDRHYDALLERALYSLIEQTHKAFEVVVVLDECHGETHDIVESYKEYLKLSHHSKPRKEGLAVAKNFGLSKCSTDWIAYLDADDLWMPCKLEVQRNYMIANPDIDFCGTESWDMDASNVLRPNCFAVGQYQDHLKIASRLQTENVMCHGSMIIRRAALERLGGYNTSPQVLGREDWDLWRRAVQANYIFGKVPERLYVWSAGTSVTR